MSTEFSGIERRLDELGDRLARLQPFTDRPRDDFAQDPYLRDIVERNLEVPAQCCLDICHRIIALEGARKRVDYSDAILRMGVLPPEFARQLAPLAGFRSILVHEYVPIDWDEAYRHLQRLSDMGRFAELVRAYMRRRASDPQPQGQC